MPKACPFGRLNVSAPAFVANDRPPPGLPLSPHLVSCPSSHHQGGSLRRSKFGVLVHSVKFIVEILCLNRSIPAFARFMEGHHCPQPLYQLSLVFSINDLLVDLFDVYHPGNVAVGLFKTLHRGQKSLHARVSRLVGSLPGIHNAVHGMSKDVYCIPTT